MPRTTHTAVAPYRVRLGRLGDDPATIAQIISAGYDPSAPEVTYTVDDSGNVLQNITVTAPAPTNISATAAPQKPLWPLLAVLGLVGYSLFWSGKHS